MHQVWAFQLPLLVSEVFQNLVDGVWVVVCSATQATSRIHHLLVILHQHWWGTPDAELLHTSVNLEDVLVCQGINVHHVLRFNDFEHMMLDVG